MNNLRDSVIDSKWNYSTLVLQRIYLSNIAEVFDFVAINLPEKNLIISFLKPLWLTLSHVEKVTQLLPRDKCWITPVIEKARGHLPSQIVDDDIAHNLFVQKAFACA